MQGGFSFCETDILDLGLEYVPDNVNTYVFADSTYRVHEQSFDGHNGGYFFGTTVEPKVFTLRCIFQDSHINDGILTRIENFFYRGRTGKLVFKKRPWVYYIATVTNLNVKSITNYLNGVITIQMKAYYPFGRCDDQFYSEDSEHVDNIVANSCMLPEALAMPASVVRDGDTLSEQTEITQYNGGTRPAAVAIELAGDLGDGITIKNVTNGKECRFVALTKSESTLKGMYLVSDGLNGRTVLTDGTTAIDASLYHDHGFMELEPSRILVNNERAYMVEGKYVASISSGPRWPEDTIGKYIHCDGKWREVVAWSGSAHNGFSTLPQPENTLLGPVTVVEPNKIVITPDSTMSLTKLNFVYKPTFA